MVCTFFDIQTLNKKLTLLYKPELNRGMEQFLKEKKKKPKSLYGKSLSFIGIENFIGVFLISVERLNILERVTKPT